MSAIAQQASAVEAAVRLVGGGATKPSQGEREYLLARLKEAARTLRWVERNEAAIRAAAEAA